MDRYKFYLSIVFERGHYARLVGFESVAGAKRWLEVSGRKAPVQPVVLADMPFWDTWTDSKIERLK